MVLNNLFENYFSFQFILLFSQDITFLKLIISILLWLEI